MRKLVRCACLLLVFGFVFSACVRQDDIENENHEKESIMASDLIKTSISKNNYERFDLLMTKYINDTKIYGISVANGIYDKVQVEISGKTQNFDWLSLADDEYLPYITYGDINADEVNECIIIMNEDLGDGKIREHLHVLNPETLDEIETEDAIEHITNNLTLKEENELEVIVLDDVVVYSSITDALKEENLENTIDNELENENEENLEKEETISLLDRISFLNNVHYKVNGNNILVNVKFNLDNDEINSLDINYVFEEDKLICKP